jgi:glycosyltransferase involved in cell wall biosynthesis
MADLVVVSFRLGGTDGVSVESAKWIDAFRRLGHRVTTVAGSGVADTILPALAIGAAAPPRREDVGRALAGADLVVVENLASLPLNPGAREVLYDALEDRAALFHHHDLPWQRPQWRDDDGPRGEPGWFHVTINELSRRELAARGVEALTIYNSFDCDPPHGRRAPTRARLGVADERLILLPTRALERKNVPAALALAEGLDGVLWLLGPAEDGYGPTLERLLAATSAPFRRGLPEGFDVHDAYAAADLVTLPSTWEGFGNPVLESVTHDRPLTVFPYPVLEEIRSFGFEFFDLEALGEIDGFLAEPDPALLERNRAIARRHFNVADLPRRLGDLLAAMDVA